MSRKNILFFTSRLGGGGAEMHLLRIVNSLDRERFDVSLVVARGGGSYESMLRPDVTLHQIFPPGKKSSTLAMLQSTKALKEMIRETRPCAVLPVMGHACASMAKAVDCFTGRDRPKLICVIQNNLSAQIKQLPLPLKMAQFGIKRAYRQSDQIIALSTGVAEDLCESIPACRGKVAVIHNAAFDEAMIERSHQVVEGPEVEGPLLVACGRLTKQKGFPVLLDAFKMVRQESNATLWILGKGQDEATLKAQASKLGIGSAVKFLGFQENPFCFFRRADIFVLSSLWEGFGNVLVEAMACGTAIVSTDCPFGPAEILDNGRYGKLVPARDASALAGALIELLLDSDQRNRLATLGMERAHQFSSPLIAEEYGRLIDETIDGSIRSLSKGPLLTTSECSGSV
ncbi:glycosyltransferase [Stieleria neptunia]|uniref:glycosyltransferase n=1 Tax=Stieleria neptunia TaxID=2527979 RepID=UPI0018D21A03|nr:glycosyltransferase [Stieleria neptunia]